MKNIKNAGGVIKGAARRFLNNLFILFKISCCY